LFVWLAAVREHVLRADGPSSSRGASERPQSYEAGSGRAHARRRSSGASGPTRERIPYEAAFWKAASFSELTRQALTLAERVGDPYASVLRLLADCVEAPERESVLYRQQNQGCSYKQLATIAHRVGMSKQQRIGFYRVCESIPMSARHAGHILSRLSK